MFAWLVERTPEAMPLVILCVSCGYLSHLLADAVTKAPIRLFWPHPRRVWALPEPLRIDTGERVERYLLQPLAVLAAFGVIALQVGALRDEITARTDACDGGQQRGCEHPRAKAPAGCRHQRRGD